ncbi:tRNA-dihydrouridine synthase 3 [Paracoccidioides brasiliensis Pb18]|uniref:tRNA-dihydrouridine(47) synthase [NAD(P)(+)] n=2 Tax=Paracoccidioides brasiliensis TaxID=121759 RepID=A0A0A0HWH6_PARBD|nr:tRNA-dihydrouridine synthase 3 [Paracoccidioides brasiliensis Pb18]KGM91725.1 tRNA-dihydrouridine synthase 3 [Paracoccidioides brasiliensis Pb18]ODH26125.1 tRNA-dihydrouridine(47) synthase [NAD(P)(+)] [Paracoccidioides brasiliensis]
MERPPSDGNATQSNGTGSAESAGGEIRKANGYARTDDYADSPAKRIKLDGQLVSDSQTTLTNKVERKKGVAPIKKEYLIEISPGTTQLPPGTVPDDDAAEAAKHHEQASDTKSRAKRAKKGGQNVNRKFGRSQDEKQLCQTVAYHSEFSPDPCPWGTSCKFEHDIRKYLKEYKRADLDAFGGVCPVWEAKGRCPAGWKCRFVGSHMTERETKDGRKELALVEDFTRMKNPASTNGIGIDGAVNVVSTEDKLSLAKRRYKTPKADSFTSWLDKVSKEVEKNLHGRNQDEAAPEPEKPNGRDASDLRDEKEENRARYTEPPFLPSEKRRVYFGPETPVLAPLTTQGNLPFRRLCVDLGAQLTYSEMAMSMNLVQGSKSEWALMKAHESETLPPTVNPNQTIVKDYDNSRDLKFGAQITGNKPWVALKATEALTALCPQLRVIDMNCGCPIDMVFREGSGSALLDHASKLEKILRGMNAVSGEIPITAKIRMGTKDSNPNATKLIERLVLGGVESHEIGQGPAGVAAITLHGRSRQQRYSRQADWGYIGQCAALVKRLNEQINSGTDTAKEADARYQSSAGKVFFLGNGDCYSHGDYFNGIRDSGVDTVMIARGALMKPWIFEEISKGQYLDKSATERLALVEKFVKYGLEAWGSDEYGIGNTRRFLLEYLCFTHRYIPVGLLEYLPPSIQDRPPAWKGRNELETLLGSDNYKDWIKISEMFLGPAHKDFQFEPKHKTNSYEIVAEG